MNKSNQSKITVWIVSLCSLVFILFGCGHNENRITKQHYDRLLREWMGKELTIPPHLEFSQYGRGDSIIDVKSQFAKILIYVDSTGCTSCKLNLDKWDAFMSEIDSFQGQHIESLFVINADGRSRDMISRMMEYSNFQAPVCFDKNDALNRTNHFPPEQSFHVFLIDNQNRVLCVGNPIRHEIIKDRYIEIIKSVDY